jgi:hypothetical protein
MRSILVDCARTRGAQKRGGGWKAVELTRGELAIQSQADHVVAVDEALRARPPRSGTGGAPGRAAR